MGGRVLLTGPPLVPTMVESGWDKSRVKGAAKDVSSDVIRLIGIEFALLRDGPA
jgi:hypothetical protein